MVQQIVIDTATKRVLRAGYCVMEYDTNTEYIVEYNQIFNPPLFRTIWYHVSGDEFTQGSDIVSAPPGSKPLYFKGIGRIRKVANLDGVFRPNYSGNICCVEACISQSGTSGSIIIDITLNAVSIFESPDDRLQLEYGTATENHDISYEIATHSFEIGDKIQVSIAEVQDGRPEDITVTLWIN